MIRRRRPDEAQLFHDAWNGRGVATAEVESLVRTAEQICAVAADVEPSQDFRSSLRASLMAEAATVLAPLPASKPDRFVEVAPAPTGRGRRRVAGLAIATVTAVGAVGMVSGSASAVPGDALYGVKRGVEQVELSLRQSPESRGTYQLQRAATRLSEAKTLSESSGDQAAVADLLHDFSDQAESGSTTLFDEFTNDGSRSSIEAVNRFTASAATSLATLSPSVPDDARVPFEQAAATVSDLVDEVAGLCSTCTDVDVSQLISTVTDIAAASGTPKAQPRTTKAPAAAVRRTTAAPAVKPVQPSAAATTAPEVVPTPAKNPVGEVVKTVTDPVGDLVGAVLGNEKQEGLVPGLLNGLLGGGKK